MRYHAIAASALLAAADIVSADCAADNCLRALRATQTPGRLESAREFCATYTKTSVPATAIPTFASKNCKKNQNGDLPERLSSACSCIATPTSSPTAPCAEVSSSWAAQIKTNPTPTVAAELAHECLKTVPLHKQEAIELVDSIEPYLEWQSDPGYLKDPPEGYYYPGFDIFANLAKVKSNLKAGKYAGEFDFQTDLYKTVIGPGHDGHYIFYPDLLTRAIKWTREKSLVSISEDGSSLPVIKLYDEVKSSPDKASAITKINGIEASKYVLDTINEATYNQDVDSAYNSMFYENALHASSGLNGYFKSGGRISLIYQGKETSFTFANGTTAKFENKAAVVGDMSGVTDGESFYKKFCTPVPFKAASTPKVKAPVSLPGYPKPVIQTDDAIVTGYYLEGEGVNDVAVIALLGFDPESPKQFQAVIQDFFAEATAAGKKKLIIDFQANGGGYILLGYDFFRQLFPHKQEDGFSRWNANKAFLAISKAVSDEVEDLDPETSGDESAISDYESWFNYRYDLNLTNENFETFDDKFSPHVYRDTRYTAIMRWNLSDPLTTINSTYGIGIDITGYRSRKDFKQPFDAENIVILYDGVCASTCSLASEMLRIQGGVKSVAFGGRPFNGPIQGAGGVKGSQILDYSDIYTYVQRAAELTDDKDAHAEFARYKSLPFERSTASACNVRDQILKDNVNDGVPAQFIAEEADCRLYWTASMLNDPVEIWKATANAAFNGHKCAYGGIKRSAKASSAAAKAPKKAGPRLSDKIDAAAEPQHDADWFALHNLKSIP